MAKLATPAAAREYSPRRRTAILHEFSLFSASPRSPFLQLLRCVVYSLQITSACPSCALLSSGSPVSFAEHYFDQYSTVIPEVRDGISDLCLTCCASWTRSPVCYPTV